jgi:hypothetical protein
VKALLAAAGLAVSLILTGCSVYEPSSTAGKPCTIELAPPSQLRTPDGRAVLIDVAEVVQHGGAMLLAGHPTVIWEHESGIQALAVNAFIAMLYGPSGDVTLLKHPVPDAEIGTMKFLRDGDGWLLLWTEEGEELASGFHATAGLFEARWENGDWQYIRAVPADDHLPVIRPSDTVAFRKRNGDVVWVLRSTALRHAGMAGAPEAIVVFTRDTSGWSHRRLETGHLAAITYLQRPDGDGLLFLAHAPYVAERANWVPQVSSLPIDSAGAEFTKWWELGPQPDNTALWVHPFTNGVHLSWLTQIAYPEPELRAVSLRAPEIPAGDEVLLTGVQTMGRAAVAQMSDGRMLFAATARRDTIQRTEVHSYHPDPSAMGGPDATCTTVVPAAPREFLHIAPLDGNRFLLIGPAEIGGRPVTIQVPGHIEQGNRNGGYP